MRTPSTPRQDKHPPSRGYHPSTKIRCRSELEAQGACLTWCCCMIAHLPASVSVCASCEVSRWTFAARIADLRWQRSFVVLVCLGRPGRWRFHPGRLADGRTTDESRCEEGKMRWGNQSTLSMRAGMAFCSWTIAPFAILLSELKSSTIWNVLTERTYPGTWTIVCI